MLSQQHFLLDSTVYSISAMFFRPVFNPSKPSSFRLLRYNQPTGKDIQIAVTEQGRHLYPILGALILFREFCPRLGSWTLALTLEHQVWWRRRLCDSRLMVLIIFGDQSDPVMFLENILCGYLSY